MPTKKIRGLPEYDKEGMRQIDMEEICRDPEHNPPSMMVYPPGVYEHTCPRCEEKKTFTVRPVLMGM